MPQQSAVVIPVGEAEPFVQHRLGVPAHITLLFPFVPAPLVPSEIDALANLFATIQAFDFALTEVRRFPASVYLHPEPASRFIELTEMIVRRWAAYPPYGGMFPSVVPHLTIADQVPADVMDAFEQRMSGHLPIRCRATEAWLMCSDEQAVWSRRHIFTFGQIP